jgi:cyclohexanone monooxygenase
MVEAPVRLQRTPSSVDVRGNKSTDREWADSLELVGRKGAWRISTYWSQADRRRDLVHDGWTDIIRNLLFLLRIPSKESRPNSSEKMEIADFQKMNQVRARGTIARCCDGRSVEAMVPPVL